MAQKEIKQNKILWLSFEEAKKIAQEKRFRSRREYKKWAKSGNRPKNIPSTPDDIYKEEWIGWPDYLGNDNKSNRDKNKDCWSFKKAREFARGLGFKNKEQYNIWSASGKRPRYIPSHPYEIYKNKGWVGWADFLGYEAVEFLPYEQAKEFMHNLRHRIKSGEEFYECSASGKRPKNIPGSPSKIYKNKGWISWYDWFAGRNHKASLNKFKTIPAID